jgi:hypothetical protein
MAVYLGYLDGLLGGSVQPQTTVFSTDP